MTAARNARAISVPCRGRGISGRSRVAGFGSQPSGECGLRFVASRAASHATGKGSSRPASVIQGGLREHEGVERDARGDQRAHGQCHAGVVVA